jgi:hypothetical protein
MTPYGWHDVLHLAAALVLTVGGGICVVLAWRASRTAAALPASTGPAPPRTPPDVVVATTVGMLLIALSVGAALIHLAAAPEHLDELGALGFGFLLAAALQAAWACAWWLRPTRGVAWLGIALNAGIAVAWAWSRLVGLPAGETPWQAEAAGTPDVASTVFELLIVVLLLARLSGRDVAIARRARDVAPIATVAIVPLVGVVFLATLLAISVAAGGVAPDGGHGAR